MLKKQHQINAAFHFSYLFFIMFSVMSACFFVQGKSFINTGDGTTQFYAALIYLHNWEREIIYHLIYDHQLIIPLWDFSMGLGDDIITALHYYGLGDPLNLLVVFIPEASIEWFYYVTYGFRLWICGLSFLFMCKQTGISSKEGMVFSALAYCFSGFVLSHTLMYATFIYPMLFFPLILVGHKRIINNENPLLFLFSFSFLTLCSFYFSYMAVIFVAIWTSIVLITRRPFHLSFALIDGLRIAVYGILGIGLASVIFLPVTLFCINGTRLGIEYTIPVFHPSGWYVQLAFSFFSIAGSSIVGAIPFLIPNLILLFRDEKRKDLQLVVVILFLFICFPFFGHVMNGFSYENKRWMFVLPLISCYIVALKWEMFINSSINMRRALLGFLCLYFFAQLRYFHGTFNEALLQTILLGLYVLYTLRVGTHQKKMTLQKCYLLVSVLSAILFALTPFGKNYPSSFQYINTAFERYQNDKKILSEFGDNLKTNNPGRLEERTAIQDNSPALSGILAVSEYWSLINSSVVNIRTGLEITDAQTYIISHQDSRTFFNALTSVNKQMVVNGSEGSIPYGYHIDAYSEDGSYVIRKNEYALPLAYTYNARLDKSMYEKMNSVQRLEAMMQGVYIEEDSLLPTVDPYLSSYEVPFYLEGEYVSDHEIKVFNWDGNKAIYCFEPVSRCELYLLIQNFHMNPSKGSSQIYAKSLGTTADKYYLSPDSECYCGIQNYTLNFGYSDSSRDNIALCFWEPKIYQWDNIKVIAQPMEQYAKYINERKKYGPEDLSLTTNRIKCSMHDVSQDHFLCVSVAYSKGWKGYIDNKPVPVCRTNEFAIGIEVPKGNHIIEFRYCTPGLQEGIIISLISLGIAVYLSVHNKMEKCSKCANAR